MLPGPRRRIPGVPCPLLRALRWLSGLTTPVPQLWVPPGELKDGKEEKVPFALFQYPIFISLTHS